MEPFSLLKFLRAGAGAGKLESETTVTHSDSDSDDGPFFDLELAEDRDASREDNVSTCAEDGADSDAGEYKFAISSSGSSSSDEDDDGDDRTDQNLSLSPSDDLFFKGRLVPVELEPSSNLSRLAEPNSKFPVSLLKSATKFRVLMMGFKKSKQSTKTESKKTEHETESKKTEHETESNKTEQAPKPPGAAERRFFTVKFKFEEVPIMSLFSKDHGNSRSSQKQSTTGSSEPAGFDEKRLSKDTETDLGKMKYLRKVKPLYVRVSRRYGEKLGFSGQLSLVSGESVTPENEKSVKQRNFPAGLRVVSKHLGKSRSAAVTAAQEKPAVPRRRDDSLLQQQDGIQSAILHCKRSFNASRDPSSSSLASKCASETETGGEKTKKPSKEEEA